MAMVAGQGATQQAAMANYTEEMERLQELLEEKEEALISAAEIGKMLLDEKDEEAEAHEAEKEALWRRIQEMAKRVMDLEREVSEREDRRRSSGSVVPPGTHTGMEGTVDGAVFGQSGPAEGAGAAAMRSEARALRARNELLQVEVIRLQEAATETRLELEAASKALVEARGAARRRISASSAQSGRWDSSSSPSKLSPSRSRRPGGGRDSGGLGHSTGVLSPGPLSPLRRQTSGRVGAGHGHALEDEDDDDDDDDEEEEEDSGDGGEEGEEEGLGLQDRAHGSGSLLNQNRRLQEELETKDDLIAALRWQLEELRGVQAQPQARRTGAISDDISTDDDASPGGGGSGERSFMDELVASGQSFGPGAVGLEQDSDSDDHTGAQAARPKAASPQQPARLALPPRLPRARPTSPEGTAGPSATAEVEPETGTGAAAHGAVPETREAAEMDGSLEGETEGSAGAAAAAAEAAEPGPAAEEAGRRGGEEEEEEEGEVDKQDGGKQEWGQDAAVGDSCPSSARAAAEPAVPAKIYNRAERKARLAVEKLGLQAVEGIFRVSFRMAGGVVFVARRPDVFYQQAQDTYIVFGDVTTDAAGGDLEDDDDDYVQAPAGGRAKGGRTVQPRTSDPLVQAAAREAGVDALDVAVVMGQAGCSAEEAVAALTAKGGDVVNAVMHLTPT